MKGIKAKIKVHFVFLKDINAKIKVIKAQIMVNLALLKDIKS